jgi:hypothetical protein
MFWQGDQASVIGGVVEFVKELEQLVASLEAQKRRRECVADVMMSSARGRPPPVPDCEVADADMKQHRQHHHHHDLGQDAGIESMAMAALRRSEIAEVEVKVAGGSEVSLRALCVRMAPAQLSRLISALEHLNLHVLHLAISNPQLHTLLYTFALKVLSLSNSMPHSFSFSIFSFNSSCVFSAPHLHLSLYCGYGRLDIHTLVCLLSQDP